MNFEVQRAATVLKSAFRYRATGPATTAAEDSLEFHLLERYRLFATDGDGERMNSVRVCHAPYEIRAAEVTEWGDALLRLAGLPPPERQPDHACASDPVEVEVFAPERVDHRLRG